MSVAAIESHWLGLIQTELGVLKSNVMLRDVQIEDLQRRIDTDQALIEALKLRAFAAEQANAELKAMIRPESSRKAGRKR